MKNLLVLLTILCATVVSAQSEKGRLSVKPMAGVNISTFACGEDVYKAKVGLTGGIEAEYGMADRLGLSLGLMYSRQGAKIDGGMVAWSIDEQGNHHVSATTINGKLVAEYLNLPLLASFYIPGIKGLSVKAGVQLGLLVGDKMDVMTETLTDVIPNSTYTIVKVDENTLPTHTFKHTVLSDICKSVDFGIPVGITYEYRHVTLDARYHFGLTKVDKTEDAGNERNRCLSITLGYRFHL